MSVYIKGMEMPEDEGDSIHILRDGTVVVYRTGSIDFYRAVPVPDHGDLIDRNATREIIKPWSPEDEWSRCTVGTAKKLMHTMLDRAPTIIPASSADKEIRDG